LTSVVVWEALTGMTAFHMLLQLLALAQAPAGPAQVQTLAGLAQLVDLVRVQAMVDQEQEAAGG
jgi:hypothetical protein